jgi:hypothetical protein
VKVAPQSTRVPGALVPVEIDRAREEGLHVEPNVCRVHPAFCS